MFIRKVPHKNNKNRKEYYTYKLVESIRTQRGPRQQDVLNLGVDFDLPKEQWKDLANCIEAIITKQRTLFDYPKKISRLARKYARTIVRQQACAIDEGEDIFKEKKVEGIKNKFQQCYAAELLKARNALDLKNGTKRNDKVIERIGRLSP